MSRNIENRYQPDFVSHPGTTLIESLEEQSMSQAELSRRMGRPKKTVNEIIQGKSGITSETALQLEKVLGVPATFWVNRQRHYDEFVARSEERQRLEPAVDWLDNFPVKRMTDYGWIRKCNDKVDQLLELLGFFGVASPKQWEVIVNEMIASFRLAKSYESRIEDISAWLRRGELKAQDIHCEPYNENEFVDLLHTRARELTLEPPDVFQPELVDLCSSVGVAVTFIPQLPKARVSGATRWLSSDKALIQLSLRYRTDDHLWFTFFHEAGHIVKHGKRDIYLESINGSFESEEKEIEADKFAADILIPPKALEEFLNSLPADRFPSRTQIINFSKDIGIAPSIIVGRLQHDKLPKSNPLPFSHYHDLKIKLQWGDD